MAAASSWDIAGTIADSFASLGTVGALLWAVYIFRRQVNDNRSLQASQVLVTLESYGDNPPRGRTRLVLENRSNLPVFDVVAVIQQTQKLRVEKVVSIHSLLRLQAGETQTFEEPMNEIMAGFAVSTVIFRDAAGRPWLRNADGDLKPYRYELDRTMPTVIRHSERRKAGLRRQANQAMKHHARKQRGSW